MESTDTPAGPVLDRRVRRSRAALMRAAVDLVSERGTTAVSVSDLAATANVSRQLVYQQFGDRDTLLLEAARDFADRKLVQRIAHSDRGDSGPRDPGGRALAAVRHFAEHRSFYRAMLTGPCGYRLSRELSALLAPVNRRLALSMAGADADPALVDDLTEFVTGGSAAVINDWLVQAPDPLDAEAFAARLTRMQRALAATATATGTLPAAPEQEPHP